MSYRLSKSKILSGIQCRKRLWLEVHKPDEAGDDVSAMQLMSAGQDAGEIAWRMFPGGHLIEYDQGLKNAIKETTSYLAAETVPPVYEATFNHDGVLVRADILTKGPNGLDVVEVKSSTSVKDYHLWDCAIQLKVIEGAGYDVERIQVAFINNKFVYSGDGDYDGLFTLEDVTGNARAMAPEVELWVSEFKDVLAADEPEVDPGEQCNDPFGCPFQEYCKSDDGPEYPLDCLPRARKELKQALETEGYEDIRDIPAGRLANPTMERVRRVTASGEPELLDEAKEALSSLPYPRYYLDFETVRFAVPIWVGTSPYQQLPYQWSCHVEHASGQLEHREFLDVSGMPPMRGFAESLIENLGVQAPILVYNQSFEARIIRESALRFPDLAEKLGALLDRVVDLLPITRDNYYHPGMMGSWSIKSVLPCVAPGLDYDQLDGVQDGEMAQGAFLEAIAVDTVVDRKKELRESLLRYCELDTLAMVKIVNNLLGIN